MGYETRAFIVKRYDFSSREVKGKKFFHGEDIAMIYLCKCGGGKFVDLMSKYKKDPLNIALWKFGHNGVGQKEWDELQNSDLWKNGWEDRLTEAFYNEDITEDKYGSAPVSIPAKEALEALKEDNKKEPYRRYIVLIAMLESILAEFSEHEVKEMYVVTYGH